METYMFRYTDLLFVVEAANYDEALAKVMAREGTKTAVSEWQLVNTFN
jgi:hypothetical protein